MISGANSCDAPTIFGSLDYLEAERAFKSDAGHFFFFLHYS